MPDVTALRLAGSGRGYEQVLAAKNGVVSKSLIIVLMMFCQPHLLSAVAYMKIEGLDVVSKLKERHVVFDVMCVEGIGEMLMEYCHCCPLKNQNSSLKLL